MLGLIIQFRRILTLLLAVLVSAWLASREPDQRLRIARGLQVTVLAPVQFVINKTNRIHNIFSENRRLLNENACLQAENSMLREDKKENALLRRMIGYREKSDFTLIPAEVIAEKGGAVSTNVIIAAGTQSGVQKDMPVICMDGVVGKVIESYPFHANVQLVSDPFARTGAAIARLNAPGILECRSRKKPSMHVFLHYDVQVGDSVVTSGRGGIYPKGLALGTVVSILPGDELFKIAEIALHPGLVDIENVFVVNIETKWKPFQENKEP